MGNMLEKLANFLFEILFLPLSPLFPAFGVCTGLGPVYGAEFAEGSAKKNNRTFCYSLVLLWALCVWNVVRGGWVWNGF